MKPYVLNNKPRPLAVRFWEKVDTTGGLDACWPWLGATNPQRYGHIKSDLGYTLRAHRVALALSGIDVPDTLHVLHTCDNPPCCNPTHLRVGTVSDNARDKVQRDRHPDHMRLRPGSRRWLVLGR